MIIESEFDLKYNIDYCIEVNKALINSEYNIRDMNTLESTFSSCIYYNTNILQVSSIVAKLAQNQSFIDGNKRTSATMLIYYNDEYNLGLKNISPRELANIILRVANERWTPEKLNGVIFK